ncbi:GNAT family N-acetyltransferase [bacterium]|nr:GNAT family N-acetyltransferase [bacterium]
MNSIRIHRAVPADAASIADFNCRMALETENYKLPPEKVLSGVKHLFDQPEYGFYLTAEFDGQVIGCLMITHEWSDWRDGLIWWIQSVYVVPEFRRQGIFRKMYAFVAEQAREKQAAGLRLYVERENIRAQRTYESLGMVETHYKMYEDIFDSPKK